MKNKFPKKYKPINFQKKIFQFTSNQRNAKENETQFYTHQICAIYLF